MISQVTALIGHAARPHLSYVVNRGFGSAVVAGIRGPTGGGSLSLSDIYFTDHFAFEGYLMSVVNDIIADGFFFPASVAIDGINLMTHDAPSGSAVTVQLTKSGTGDSSSNVSLAAGNKYGTGWTSFTAINFTTAQRLGFKLVSADNGLTAQSPVIGIRYKFI